MTLFLSTYVNKVDKKGRVSVPALFRQSLAPQNFQGIVTFRSYKLPCLEASGIDRMELLSQSVDNLDLFSDSQDDLATTIFADAQQIALDGDGRVLLPESLLKHANITEYAAFVGRGPTFQIWQPDAFEKHQDAARQRALSSKTTLKLNPRET